MAHRAMRDLAEGFPPGYVSEEMTAGASVGKHPRCSVE